MGRGVVGLRETLGERVARVAGSLLEVAGARQLDALDLQRHPEPPAQLAHEAFVLLRAGTQTVVHVERGRARAEA